MLSGSGTQLPALLRQLRDLTDVTRGAATFPSAALVAPVLPATRAFTRLVIGSTHG